MLSCVLGWCLLFSCLFSVIAYLCFCVHFLFVHGILFYIHLFIGIVFIIYHVFYKETIWKTYQHSKLCLLHAACDNIITSKQFSFMKKVGTYEQKNIVRTWKNMCTLYHRMPIINEELVLESNGVDIRKDESMTLDRKMNKIYRLYNFTVYTEC